MNDNRAKSAAAVGPLVVGIGASAGGLEAVQTFLGGITAGYDLSIVVLFHLDPTSKSLLAEVLGKHSHLPVSEVIDGLRLEPDQIYTIPPNSLATVVDGVCRLSPFHSTGDRHVPIDRLFQSIARDRRERGVAVLLSGDGSDGALGVKGVSDSGGITFVQSPSSAQHDGMPQSAIATGCADHVLPPEALAAELVAYASHVRLRSGRRSEHDLVREVEDALPVVCEILLQSSGHNFKHYKTSTLVRRILRRVHVLRLDSVYDYVDRLRANTAESTQLFNDLLINVTAFFRDPESFQALAENVLPKLFAKPSGDQPVRLWCAGCATGEEAYTLSILVLEYLETHTQPRPAVQIFATDIDEEALSFARQGIYPVGITEKVSPERLKRFFVKKGRYYHVTKEVRELVLFSVHNVINDPPFSRLDLISCRNLLIYLGSHLQKKLLPLFHYALTPGGFLFLGPSENVTDHRELFRAIDAKNRISQRLPTVIRTPGLVPGRSGPITPVRPPNSSPSSEPDTYLLMQRIILDEFAPKAVVVNEDGQIVTASGNLEKYMTVSAGAFHNNLVRLVRDGLKVGVRSALAEATKLRRQITHDGLSIRTDSGIQRILLTVQPMPQMGEDSGLFLVVFQDVGSPLQQDAAETTVPNEDAAVLVEQLERELSTTRIDLERTVQDLEAANEELKSGNEELLSMNEELQSANEELETSKEEVQSAHDLLARVNTDLENLLTSTQIGTIFLDEQGNLKRITAAAANVYRLRHEDVGRPLTDFTHTAKKMPPLPRFEAVRDSERPIEHEIEMNDGTILLRRVLPYRNREGLPEGVVVTFTDVSDRKRAEDSRQASEVRFRALVTATSDVIYRMSADWKEMYYLDGREFLRHNQDPNSNWVETYLPIGERAQILERISHSIATRTKFEMEHRVIRADGSLGWTFSRAIPIVDGEGHIKEWFGAASDISLQKAEQLRRAFFAEFASATQELTEPEELTDTAARMLAEHLGADRCAYAEVVSESEYVIRGDFCRGVPSIVGRWPISAFGADHLATMLHGDSYVVNDAENDSRIGLGELPSFVATKIRAVICVPLHKNGRLSAAMAVHQTVARTWTADEIELVETVVARCWEALERARIASESEKRKRLYETILSNTPDLAYVWGLDHRFLYVNEGLLRMWGKTWDEAIGKNCLELGYADWHAAMHDREIEQVRATKQPVRGEVPFTGTFGRRVYDYILVPVIGKDGDVEAVAGTTRDVTDRKNSEVHLRELDRQKDEFLATLAHELRNPLAPIRNGLSVLRLSGDVAAEGRAGQLLSMMDRQLSQMVHLVDDLLDVSRVSTGKITLKTDLLELSEIISATLEASRPALEGAGHALTVNLPKDSIPLFGDRTRLVQVFTNLLSNACKYTMEGGQISIVAEIGEENVFVRVSDNGIGIPPEMLPKVFNLFTQVNRSLERSQGGLGIGLSLAQKLVMMHGGDIEAKSNGVDSGSTFTVRLPLAVANSSLSAVEPVSSRTSDLSTTQRRVLVVDDNRDGAESLALLLEIGGHEVKIAHDGSAAITLAENFLPEVVFLDIGMPGMNGYDVARALRSNPKFVNTTIVALTGWGSDSDKQKSVEAGFDSHLTKPVEADRVYEIIREWNGHTRMT